MDRLPTFAALSAARFDAARPSLPAAMADRTWRLADGAWITIRAARPEDGPLMQALVRGLSAASSYQRFFYPLHELPPTTLARFSHADPRHDMTLLAVVRQDGREVAVGMAQYAAEWPHTACEFALVVADAWQRKGIAARLLRKLAGVARAAGFERIEGEILADNLGMRHLLGKLGFEIGPHPDGGYLRKTWRELGTGDAADSTYAAPQALLAARGQGQAQAVRR